MKLRFGMQLKWSMFCIAGITIVILAWAAFRELTPVHAQAGRLAHAHLNGSCVAGNGGTCSSTLTWVPAFSDTNYTVACAMNGPISGAPILYINTTGKTATTVTVNLLNVSATSAEASALNCIGLSND